MSIFSIIQFSNTIYQSLMLQITTPLGMHFKLVSHCFSESLDYLNFLYKNYLQLSSYDNFIYFIKIIPKSYGMLPYSSIEKRFSRKNKQHLKNWYIIVKYKIINLFFLLIYKCFTKSSQVCVIKITASKRFCYENTKRFSKYKNYIEM